MNSCERNSRLPPLFFLCLAIILLGLPAQGAVSTDDDPLNSGDVLVGPCGVPGAIGPTGVNDDFTNRSINTGIANVPPGGVTSAAGTVVFRNTVQNIGVADDLFLLTAPIVPAGFAIEMSTDQGDNYVALEPQNPGVALPLAYRAAAIVLVRVTAPAGLKILTGFDTVFRATSTVTPGAANDTINRLYTGFIRLEKSVTTINGSGNSTVAAPGAEIEFVITYSNVTSGEGVGNSLLTAHNLVISENGNAAPNSWGQTTEHVIGASDTQGGVIIGDRDGSTSLTDLITTLEPRQSGVFKFKRRIK
jgi:hypothetical protein